MYSITETSKILHVPYSNVRRWLLRHHVTFRIGVTGKIRITDEGLEELRSIIAVKRKIKELEEMRLQ